MSIEVRAVPDVIGAEISGVALIQDICDVDFRMILEAWYDHLVLLFRGQTLSDERLVNFSKRFDTLDLAPPGEAYNTGTNSVPGIPEITVLSNVVENGVPIGALGNSECVWHTDMTYADEPPSSESIQSWSRRRRKRSNHGRTLGACDARGVRLASPLGDWRSSHLGQSMHDASVGFFPVQCPAHT